MPAKLHPAPGKDSQDWRQECSCVTVFKEAYRQASKHQRAQMRAWFLRVLDGKDSPQ